MTRSGQAVHAAAPGGHADRFDLLRFPLIVLVVYIHAYGASVAMSDGTVGIDVGSSPLLIIQFVLSQVVARIAVPLFFFLSGYLFFRSGTLSSGEYVRKMHARVRTLLIPFLFWNVVTFAAIYLAQSLPATAPYFVAGKAKLASLNLGEQLALILGFTRYPISYQFWFIRDLMVVAVATPLIYLALRYAWFVVMPVLFALWLAGLPLVPVISTDSILFFSLGSLLALKGVSPFTLDRFLLVLLAAWAVLAAVTVAFLGSPIEGIARRFAILDGAAVALALTGIVMGMPRLKLALLALAPASFFVFATHEPTLTIFKKLAYRVVPITPASALAIYIALPVVIIALTTAIYALASRVLPRATAFVTGGR